MNKHNVHVEQLAELEARVPNSKQLAAWGGALREELKNGMEGGRKAVLEERQEDKRRLIPHP